MANSVEICNLALSHIGSSSIESLSNPKNKEARQCALLYPISRDAALRDHDWGFARKRASLALTDLKIEGWDFVYQYPSDCLSPREIYNHISYPAKVEERVPFETGANGDLTGNVILTNEENALLIYTAKLENTNLFDALFVEALSWRLAADLAIPIKGKADLEQRALNRYMQIVGLAKARNSNEGYKAPDHGSSFLKARL